MSKEDVIEVEGKVVETLPNTIETIKVDTESESYIVENKCLYTKDKKES